MISDGLDFLSDFEERLAEWLAGQAELATAVRTFEADMRPALISGEELSKGFPDGQLPAINVVAGLDDVVSVPRAMTSATITFPVSLIVVAKGQSKKEATRNCRGIQDALEMVLNRIRKSGNTLGHNTVLFGEMRTTCTWEQNGPRFYGLGETKVSIQRVREMSL